MPQLTELQKKYGPALGGHRLTYHRAKGAAGIVYQVRVAGLANDDAKSLCAKLTGAGLSAWVSTGEPYTVPAVGAPRFRVAALDLGVKTSSLRMLAARGAEIRVLPEFCSADQLLAPVDVSSDCT